MCQKSRAIHASVTDYADKIRSFASCVVRSYAYAFGPLLKKNLAANTVLHIKEKQKKQATQSI